MKNFLHLESIDPRIKLFILILLSSASLFLDSLFRLTALLFLTVILLVSGGVSLKKMWRQIRLMLQLIAVLFLVQCIFLRDGEPLFSIYGLTLITTHGFHAACRVMLRLLIILSSAQLTMTGNTRDYLLALTWFRLPPELAYMTLAALRFVPLLASEAKSVQIAMEMRGVNFAEAPVKKKLQYYLFLLVPVTAGALNRAEQMSISMEARGFRSQPERTNWRKLHIQANDFFYFALFLLFYSLILLYQL